jgi:hypothetical protein
MLTLFKLKSCVSFHPLLRGFGHEVDNCKRYGSLRPMKNIDEI